MATKNSLSELLAQKAALEKQIAEYQRAQRGEAITKIKTLMAEHGLTLADLGSAKSAPATAAPAPAPKKSAAAGRKIAPKYRNPATGDTWSGRGLKPKWLAAAIAGGKTLADFAV